MASALGKAAEATREAATEARRAVGAFAGAVGTAIVAAERGVRDGAEVAGRIATAAGELYESGRRALGMPPAAGDARLERVGPHVDHFAALRELDRDRLAGLLRASGPEIVNYPEQLSMYDEDTQSQRQYTLGNTLLHVAADMGDVEAMRLVVEHGGRVNKQNVSRQLPLHLAAASASRVEGLERLTYGDAVNAVDSVGRTPLHYAAASNNVDGMFWLLGQGADVTVVDDRGQTPVHAYFARTYGREVFSSADGPIREMELATAFRDALVAKGRPDLLSVKDRAGIGRSILEYAEATVSDQRVKTMLNRTSGALGAAEASLEAGAGGRAEASPRAASEQDGAGLAGVGSPKVVVKRSTSGSGSKPAAVAAPSTLPASGMAAEPSEDGAARQAAKREAELARRALVLAKLEAARKRAAIGESADLEAGGDDMGEEGADVGSPEAVPPAAMPAPLSATHAAVDKVSSPLAAEPVQARGGDGAKDDGLSTPVSAGGELGHDSGVQAAIQSPEASLPSAADLPAGGSPDGLGATVAGSGVEGAGETKGSDGVASPPEDGAVAAMADGGPAAAQPNARVTHAKSKKAKKAKGKGKRRR